MQCPMIRRKGKSKSIFSLHLNHFLQWKLIAPAHIATLACNGKTIHWFLLRTNLLNEKSHKPRIKQRWRREKRRYRSTKFYEWNDVIRRVAVEQTHKSCWMRNVFHFILTLGNPGTHNNSNSTIDLLRAKLSCQKMCLRQLHCQWTAKRKMKDVKDEKGKSFTRA